MPSQKIIKKLFIIGLMFVNFHLFAINLPETHTSFSNSKTWIGQLAINESFSIIIDSEGCFNSSQDIIAIHRTDDKYFINWKNQSKELSHNDIEFIKLFEKKLSDLKPGSCTTTITYTIKYKDEITKIVDGNCISNGINQLKDQIFIN